jgi:ABC-type phosphate transport system substrate-binding protein
MKHHYLSALALGLTIAASVGSHAVAGDVVAIMAPVAAPLTKDQVAGIFLGRATDLKPVDLPESSVARELFYKKATGRDTAQVRAVWARLIFTGRGKLPIELPDAAAVKKAVAADPNLVGYIDKADLDASVKVVLSLN